ncbi:hypothetical protein WJX77_006173 [Trebouxia sp. C0004]
MAPRLQRALSMQPSIDLPVVDKSDAASVAGQHRYELAEVEWTSDDAADTVQRKLHRASVNPDLVNEYVQVHIQSVSPDIPGGFIKAAAPQDIVEVQLVVQQTPPQLRRLELVKLSSTGVVDATLLSDMLQFCDLEGLTRLRFSEGMLRLWEDDLINRLTALRSLNLSSCGLFALPSDIGRLAALRELRLSDNRLIALPKEVGQLMHLRRLVADNNMLTAIPVELKRCSDLREVSLESNRLTTPVMDLRALSKLESLQLYGNPLEFLPELSPCTNLRHLSLANVRIAADEAFTQWDVDVTATSYISRGNKLAQLFALIFRRSSCQQPLLAGALGSIAEDPFNCEVISHEEGAVQQLILMALSDNEVVVEQACKTIGLLGQHNTIASTEIIQGGVMAAMLTLICSAKHKSQLAGLQVLASLALVSDAAAQKLMSQRLLTALQELIRSGADDVKSKALQTAGNLAFCHENRSLLLQAEGFKEVMVRMADQGAVVKHEVRMSAIRALAILGENEEVGKAVGRAPIEGRGVRILCMDGGGMKGLSTLRMLRELERCTGKRIHELFDLICGTSTGGILAASLALQQFTLDDCDDIYRNLGTQVFSRPLVQKDQVESWRESLYRVYKSGQQSMRVAVYGTKHDASLFEELLKEASQFEPLGTIGDTMIDTACLNIPKCFVVATLASMTPAVPFIFRNYEYSPDSQPPRASAPPNDEASLYELGGSSKHLVWQAVRASSAAPYYLDDFVCGQDRFQDGASTANNPSGLAMQEALRLWPHTPVDCLVSLGSGSVPITKREKSMSAYLDTGSVLIESACNVERIAAVLYTLAPFVPNFKYYRFNPLDKRCGINLDEIDPAKWSLLEAATDDYIAASQDRFQQLADLLVAPKQRPGPHQSLVVVTAAPPTPGPPLHPSDAEEVGRMCQQLPQCVGSCDLHQEVSSSGRQQHEASSSGRQQHEASSSGRQQHEHVASGASTMQALEACVEAAGTVGVVHLALHSDQQGLITRWKTRLKAYIDPGPEAQAFVRELGQDPAQTSLADIFRHAQNVHSPTGQHSVLSIQSHAVAGSMVTTVLVQHTEPAAHLTAQMVALSVSVWRERLIATAAPLAPDLIQAFLAAGASVISRDPESASQPSGADTADCFMRMYEELFSRDATVPAAMKSAGLQHQGFCCHGANQKVL